MNKAKSRFISSIWTTLHTLCDEYREIEVSRRYYQRIHNVYGNAYLTHLTNKQQAIADDIARNVCLMFGSKLWQYNK